MNTIVLDRPQALRRTAAGLHRLWIELHSREARLARYGALLLVLLLPLALGWALDARELRGVNVWVKPMKFAVSIALLALTTAWFAGRLPPPARRSAALTFIVWLLIACGTFELGYITLQAALGEGSHYNLGDRFHQVMYALMGAGALALTATQPLLAWQLHRHAQAAVRATVQHRAVVVGLVLTFVLGAGAGIPLSALQPPNAGAGAAVPLFGWPLAGGDLRPAHFVGIHAGQLIPLAGWWLAQRGAPARALRPVVIGYGIAFAAATAWGLAGRF